MNNVIVTDVRMPFMSMVIFLVKVSLAAIPAALILTGIVFLFQSFLGFAII
jgi:hypothetical protein